MFHGTDGTSNLRKGLRLAKLSSLSSFFSLFEEKYLAINCMYKF